MADAMALLVAGPKWLYYVLFFSVICLSIQLLLHYTRYVAVRNGSRYRCSPTLR